MYNYHILTDICVCMYIHTHVRISRYISMPTGSIKITINLSHDISNPQYHILASIIPIMYSTRHPREQLHCVCCTYTQRKFITKNLLHLRSAEYQKYNIKIPCNAHNSFPLQHVRRFVRWPSILLYEVIIMRSKPKSVLYFFILCASALYIVVAP